MTARVAGLALVVALAGCHRSWCERKAALARSCDDDVSADELDACEDDLRACTEDDRTRIDGWFDCVEATGAFDCDPSRGGGTDALVTALDCRTELDGLSDACTPPNP